MFLKGVPGISFFTHKGYLLGGFGMGFFPGGFCLGLMS